MILDKVFTTWLEFGLDRIESICARCFQYYFNHIISTVHMFMYPPGFFSTRLEHYSVLPKDIPTKTYVQTTELTLSQTSPFFTCLQYKSFENTVGKEEIAQ